MDHHIVQLEGPKDIITEQLDARNFEYEIVDYEALGEELLWAHDKKAAKKRSKAKAKEDAKKAKAEAKEEGEEGEEEASEDETADASEGTEAAG